MSDFGPANDTNGAWECPDLFPLQLDGGQTKWVLVVNINPGGIAGGSGTQYFVGDFDGTPFTAENAGAYTPPAGDVFQDFEAAGYGGWTATGTAFGSGPARGTLPGQQDVSGFSGSGLVNSFAGGDGAQGTLTSPTFRISKDYVNFLIGGGAHAHDPAAGDGTSPPGDVLGDFETADYGGWTPTGDFAGTSPHIGGDGGIGARVVDTFFGRAQDSDNNQGTIVSPDFTISRDYLNFLIAGGSTPDTAVHLVVDGATVRSASGQDSGTLNWVAWNVGDLRGKRAHLEIVDHSTGGWGHVLADQFMLADAAREAPRRRDGGEPAGRRRRRAQHRRTRERDARLDRRGTSRTSSAATRRSRSSIATAAVGATSWPTSSCSPTPAQSAIERSSWADYGRDFYAAVTWNDTPDGKRILLGWVNNWDYGDQVPTSPWRSAMSVPRELSLKTIDGHPQLVSQPIAQLDGQHAGAPYHEAAQTLTGERTLNTTGTLLDIRATLHPQTAAKSGIKVLAGANGDQTVIGYDAATGSVYLDRTHAGTAAAAITGFPGVQSAPVSLHDGALDLRILVDNSIVEVYANHGERVLTDQVYPAATSNALKAFADGGSATLDSLDVYQMRSSWLETQTTGGVGGTVPATLSLSLGPAAAFGPFTPGVAKDYLANTTATVTSTAGDATLSVQDPSSTATGRLVNGTYALTEPLQANANGAPFAPLSTNGLPLALLTYTGPASNNQLTIGFKQPIAATQPLRTGTYSKTLTYTLSTTNP